MPQFDSGGGVSGGGSAPVNTSPPTLVANAYAGNPVSSILASNGTWDIAVDSYNVTYTVNGSGQPGTYTMADGDVCSATVVATTNGQSSLPASTGNITAQTVAGADADFALRASGAGVLFAHNFERDEEMDAFIRGPSGNGIDDPRVTNPDPAALYNPLFLRNTSLGSSRSIVGRVIGSTLTAPVPAAQQGDTQVWQVANAAEFPDPVPFGGYPLLVGKVGEGSKEYIKIVARDTGANTITVERLLEIHSITVEGVGYSGTNAPPYPAGYRVGRGQQGSWNRPLCSFPAGQNGKLTDDEGIGNGAAAKTRTWDPSRNSSSHLGFREGFWCHKSYWDETVFPQPHGPAPYKNWTPYDTFGQIGGERTDVYEGDEFYLQFRAKISPERLQWEAAKMLFIQAPGLSGSGQFFWVMGPQKYDEVQASLLGGPEAGVQYGQYLTGLTSYGDGAAPAGGILSSGGNRSSNDTDADGLQSGGLANLCRYDSRAAGGGPGMECWCFPIDKWVTYHLHFKLGRDNSGTLNEGTVTPNALANNGNSNVGLTGPWPGETDPAFQTLVEIQVAVEGETSYTTVMSYDKFIWFWGDGKYDSGYYAYHPPGLGAVWMMQDANSYFGGGSIAAPPVSCEIEYTQCILSRNPIPCPQV